MLGVAASQQSVDLKKIIHLFIFFIIYSFIYLFNFI